MKNVFENINLRYGIMTILFNLTILVVIGQTEGEYRYEDGKVIVAFDVLRDTTLMNNALDAIGASCGMIDSLEQITGEKRTVTGWELVKVDSLRLEFRKPIDALACEGNNDFLVIEEGDTPPYKHNPFATNYGVNHFRSLSFNNTGEDNFLVRFADFPNAQNVYLAGTFNNWSTTETRLRQTGDGWQTSIKLKPGKYHYKFIIDGQWMTDPNNLQLESDGYGNTNSVFYNSNHSFFLSGYTDASDVYVAGSFNDWKLDDLPMISTSAGWVLPIYLTEGVHTYKFIVDGRWILDPANTAIQNDGNGNTNSLLTIGEPTLFQLDAFPNAQNVVLAGNFNNWDQTALNMNLEKGVWSLPLTLPAGNYQYKFIVDGQWMVDPRNPHQIGQDVLTNSVMVVKANHTFYLKGHKNATTVLVSGNFNDWSEDGYTMQKVGNGWTISVHLPPGKIRYKFLVDGQWKLDPKNELWEKNKYGTKDAVLWMD